MIGRRVSHFYILRQLGGGGMGDVYEAQDTRLPRSVAIKFLKSALSTNGEALRRFKREARLASSLNHPNICTIFDIEDGDGESFIAMELLRGCSLKDRLLGDSLTIQEIVDIAIQVAGALAAAHDQGIIHRDLKPGNVFLTESGLVKLLDFGLAKHVPTYDGDTQTTENLTAPGAIVGTLYYIAPEQLAEDAAVDYRCDLFSFGTLLYEMVAGARPFDASPRSALIAAIQSRQHDPLRQRAPECPEALEQIVDRLLAKRPADRYQSAHALRTDLEALHATATNHKRARTPIRTDVSRPDTSHSALRDALADRYALGEVLGRGGMATVYAAGDLRHRRRVAIKLLDPSLGAMLGAERFLAEIHVTAGLQHPNLLPLFDSGEAAGLLYYVMPLVEGASLRARLARGPQLSVDEAVRLVSTIAGALDYAHRQGVVHRDLKPENILVQDGQPLVADFGIALAVTRAGGPNLTAAGTSLGTPRYMSPEQALGDSGIDGRSDIYSLACVLYELLVGDPPFTGRSSQAVIAKVISEPPPSARTVRPTIPAHIDSALTRALAKLPADRFATAREFADALIAVPATSSAGVGSHAKLGRWRRPSALVLGAVAVVAVAGAAWMARAPDASTDFMVVPYPNLIDQTQFGTATLTPDGRALVYTGSAAAGRPLMLWRLDERAAHPITGTEGGMNPFVSSNGKRLAFRSAAGGEEIIAIDGAPTHTTSAWRFGNGAWLGDSSVITEGGPVRGLYKHRGDGATRTVITRPDTTQGETKHVAPLVLPGGRYVVFTVSKRAGPGLVSGPLAIAPVDPGSTLLPHVLLGVTARRAIAFVDEKWLLYASDNGKAVMAVQLDVANQRIVGNPVSVWSDAAGNLETASLADNGTMLYLRIPRLNSVVFVDSNGAPRPELPGVDGSFMNPRLSPDGKHFAVQVASAAGEDVWVYDVGSRTPKRLTTSGKALQPTWTPDGRRIVYMMAAYRGIVSQPVEGGPGDTIPGTASAFAPTVSPDGKFVAFKAVTGDPKIPGTIWSAPLGGEGARRQLADNLSTNQMPTFSPDGRWLAFVSSSTGSNEVYVRSYPALGPIARVSDGGGTEPAWSPDSRRIYYRGNGTFMSATLDTATLAVTRRPHFADASDNTMPHRNYDVMPNGKGFLMIAPTKAGGPEAVMMLNWLPRLRAQLAASR